MFKCGYYSDITYSYMYTDLPLLTGKKVGKAGKNYTGMLKFGNYSDITYL